VGRVNAVPLPWVVWFLPGVMDPSGRLGYGPPSRWAIPVENNRQAARRFYEEVINGQNARVSRWKCVA
jgi:hypothetical protein